MLIFLCRQIYSSGQTPDSCVGSLGVPLEAGLSIFGHLVENNSTPLARDPSEQGVAICSGRGYSKDALASLRGS